ncbi:MAG: zinc-ribbon domain containing protein [Chloroflexi bacterium]|nr:zinc-ribbon domain containing protein [Chloroflexota bacterium]MBV9601172.1 zinc-ribbon domain containing protein [Chloroflexota bacterium]
MEERAVDDKALCCASCGDGFVFSSGEQELFRLRGITSEPTQCPRCARGRMLVSPARGGRGAERPSG